MAKAKKNVEELYKAIFAIRDALQDAQQLAAEAAVMSDAFGGEIARVITAQINAFFIPGISKFIDDEKTPGAMSPLITFLDSVPLAMTRGAPDPQQVTPAPVESPQLATPAEAAEPAEGSYAAKTQEARKRGSKVAVSRSTRVQEGFHVIRKGAKNTQVVATFPSKEAANARAASLNETLTDMEKDFLKLEYVVKSVAAPQKKKDVSQAKALPTPKKLPESSEDLSKVSDDELRQAYLSMVNSDDAWFSGKDAKAQKYKAELDRRGAELYPNSVKESSLSRVKERKITREDIENILLDSEIEKKHDYVWSREDNLSFQEKSTANKARTLLVKSNIKTGIVEYLFGDYYLKIYNISGEDSVKESLSLKDIPIDDYTVDEAYDEMLQGGEVDSEIAPDYVAENMFGAEPGSDRHQQVKDRLSNLQKNRNTVVEESAASGMYEPDFDKLAQQVAALVEDGYTEIDALEYIRDTEEVDHNMLYDAYITLKAKY